MTDKNILIIEDDQHILKLVKYNLEKADYKCYTAITGEEALEILVQEAVDLVILDVMLPKMDGFEVCRRIRQNERNNHTPIIMLTARGEELDRVVGLELGADDYVVKPFSPRELILRMKAILKRGKPREEIKDVLCIGDLKVDIPRHEVILKGKKMELSPMEFKLLVILIKRQGRVQSRERLLDDVWGLSSEVMTRTVDTHIKLLRQKLGSFGNLIHTVRGMGYKLIEED